MPRSCKILAASWNVLKTSGVSSTRLESALRRLGPGGDSRASNWISVNEPVRQPVYAFEGFRLDAQRRVLFAPNGKSVTLTPRLFDALLYFVERAGQLLTKEQLLEAIWPRVVVEEHNLNKTVSELRRVLGEKPGEHRFLVTKPGHGYRFVAGVLIVPGSVAGEDTIAADRVAAVPGRETEAPESSRARRRTATRYGPAVG